MTTDTDLSFSHSTCSDRPCVIVLWADLEAYLGHMHGGSPADDEILTQGLLDAGAPVWVREAEGEIDESGWMLLEPEALPQSTKPITTAGWYPLEDGRWSHFAWVDGQPVQGQPVDDPKAYEADDEAAVDAWIERRASEMDDAMKAQDAAEDADRLTGVSL